MRASRRIREGTLTVQVYLVPVGRGRHALYCEPGEEPIAGAARPLPGVWRRWTDRFLQVIDTVEREQSDRPAASETGSPNPCGFWARMRVRAMAWMAEKIAEQRILWRLSGKAQVAAWVPAGLDQAQALATIRGILSTEYERHLWWLAVDALGGLMSAALMLIPGPNLIGYYFTFRIVGHLFALRGARHGLRAVRWDIRPSGPLADLASAESLPPADRERRVQRVADQLDLRRFPRFYRRAAAGPA